jgi:hypothetical protein
MNAHVIAKAIDRVHCSRRRNRLQRQLSPLWELREEQPANQIDVDVDLAIVHLRRHWLEPRVVSAPGPHWHT